MDTELKFISPQELQELLGCGRTFTYELLQSGKIPSYKLGKLRRIALADVLRYLETNKQHGPGE